MDTPSLQDHGRSPLFALKVLTRSVVKWLRRCCVGGCVEAFLLEGAVHAMGTLPHNHRSTVQSANSKQPHQGLQWHRNRHQKILFYGCYNNYVVHNHTHTSSDLRAWRVLNRFLLRIMITASNHGHHITTILWHSSHFFDIPPLYTVTTLHDIEKLLLIVRLGSSSVFRRVWQHPETDWRHEFRVLELAIAHLLCVCWVQS